MFIHPDPVLSEALQEQAVSIPEEGFFIDDAEYAAKIAELRDNRHHSSESVADRKHRAEYFLIWKHYGVTAQTQRGVDVADARRVAEIHNNFREVKTQHFPKLLEHLGGTREDLGKHSAQLNQSLAHLSDLQAELLADLASNVKDGSHKLAAAIHSFAADLHAENERHLRQYVSFWWKVLKKALWFGIIAWLLLLASILAPKLHAQSTGISVIQAVNNDNSVAKTFASPFKFKAGANCTNSISGTTWTFNCAGGSGMADPGGNGIVVRTALNTTTARSVGATSPVTVTNADGTGGNPTLACATCAIGPGSSTANHLATFSGTDGLTLADGGAVPTGVVAVTTSPYGFWSPYGPFATHNSNVTYTANIVFFRQFILPYSVTLNRVDFYEGTAVPSTCNGGASPCGVMWAVFKDDSAASSFRGASPASLIRWRCTSATCASGSAVNTIATPVSGSNIVLSPGVYVVTFSSESATPSFSFPSANGTVDGLFNKLGGTSLRIGSCANAMTGTGTSFDFPGGWTCGAETGDTGHTPPNHLMEP